MYRVLKRMYFSRFRVTSRLVESGPQCRRGRSYIKVHHAAMMCLSISSCWRILPSSGFSPGCWIWTETTRPTLFQTGEAIPINIEALDSDGKVTSVSFFARWKTDQLAGSDAVQFRRGAKPHSDGIGCAPWQWTATAKPVKLLRTISVVRNVPPSVELRLPRERSLYFAPVETIPAAARPAIVWKDRPRRISHSRRSLV